MVLLLFIVCLALNAPILLFDKIGERLSYNIAAGDERHGVRTAFFYLQPLLWAAAVFIAMSAARDGYGRIARLIDKERRNTTFGECVGKIFTHIGLEQ